MTSWLIDSPQQLTLDGDVGQLDVWFASGKVRVVGTDGPARIDFRKLGSKGATVTLEDGLLSVRHNVPKRHWFGPFWWFMYGRRRYYADVIVAVPPAASASLTLVSGSVVASGLRRGATVDVTAGSIT